MYATSTGRLASLVDVHGVEQRADDLMAVEVPIRPKLHHYTTGHEMQRALHESPRFAATGGQELWALMENRRFIVA